MSIKLPIYPLENFQLSNLKIIFLVVYFKYIYLQFIGGVLYEGCVEFENYPVRHFGLRNFVKNVLKTVQKCLKTPKNIFSINL
jgi:hypothetical protein